VHWVIEYPNAECFGYSEMDPVTPFGKLKSSFQLMITVILSTEDVKKSIYFRWSGGANATLKQA
tara:strand:- start:953 stop:1144 length:192 start_codon:yes stop_codon:yes gene_type:complete